VTESAEQIAFLEGQAKTIRCLSIEMIGNAGTGHPGGALSAAEIISVLYFKILRVNSQQPDWADRDRFVLSKGHGTAAWYAALCERGFFPREALKLFRQKGGILQGHPDMRKVPGVDMTTGSLGQGLSAGLGMALAGRMQGKSYHVYVLVGDGEIQEGQIWEAAMAASHFKVDNLTAILDYNDVQLDGPVHKVMEVAPVVDKWRAFGWEVTECDGHDVASLLQAFEAAKAVKGRPCIIVAHTTKGKGVSFMENTCDWHGVADPNKLPAALEEVQSL
jgi:transketolase